MPFCVCTGYRFNDLKPTFGDVALLQKPVDAPYGPYADDFSADQHKYGPFAPIRAALARLKAEQPRSQPNRAR